MRISVRVKLKSREEKVEKTVIQRLTGPEEQYQVYVKELPVDGKANEAVILALAEYFKVPKAQIHIIVGHTSREKIVEVR